MKNVRWSPFRKWVALVVSALVLLSSLGSVLPQRGGGGMGGGGGGGGMGGGGMGGSGSGLAALTPEDLSSFLQRHVKTGQAPFDARWQLAFHDVPSSRMRELAEVLAVG